METCKGCAGFGFFWVPVQEGHYVDTDGVSYGPAFGQFKQDCAVCDGTGVTGTDVADEVGQMAKPWREIKFKKDNNVAKRNTVTIDGMTLTREQVERASVILDAPVFKPGDIVRDNETGNQYVVCQPWVLEYDNILDDGEEVCLTDGTNQMCVSVWMLTRVSHLEDVLMA